MSSEDKTPRGELSDAERRGAQSLLAAIGFQERVLKILNAGFPDLTSREVELLDACLQVWQEDRRDTPPAGRVVVDLPEPDETRERLTGPEPIYLIGGWCVRASNVNEPSVHLEVGYLGGGFGFTASKARLIAAAILAAADAAERLSVPGSSGEVQG